jgi:hypothetical protein
MITVQIAEEQYKLEDNKLFSSPKGMNVIYHIILTEAEVKTVLDARAKVLRSSARKSYYQSTAGKVNRNLIMLDKMYLSGTTPAGHKCDINKVLQSIRALLHTPDLDIEALPEAGKEIAKRYLGS